MKDNNIKKLVYAALLAALCCVATMIIKLPTPLGGYIHAGDAVVLLSAFVLGPYWGALAAGLGSALADIVSGYALYAPGTFVVKALVALIAGVILRKAAANKPSVLLPALAGLAGELFMVAGYLVYEWFVLGFGSASLGNIPMNLIQGAFGVVAGTALFAALRKNPYWKQNHE